METKNPILNFRTKTITKIPNKNLNSNHLKKSNFSSMVTKTRESIDMTEHS